MTSYPYSPTHYEKPPVYENFFNDIICNSNISTVKQVGLSLPKKGLLRKKGRKTLWGLMNHQMSSTGRGNGLQRANEMPPEPPALS